MANAMTLSLLGATTCAWAAAPDPLQMNLEQLMAVTVVSASKYEQRVSEVAASVTVITRDEIKAYGWRTLSDALSSLPGNYRTYDRQYSYLGTRGFGIPGDLNTRILFMVNGNRVNDVVYDGGPLGRELPLDLDLVERIVYVPGPGGAVYGQNAMFGVVNVITRTGSAIKGTELRASFQSPQRQREGRATWGTRTENGTDIVLSVSAANAVGADRWFSFPGAGQNGQDIAGVAARLDAERDHEVFASIARGNFAFDIVFGNRRKDDPTASYFTDPLTSGQYIRDRYVLTQLQYKESLLDDRLQVLGRVSARV